MKKETLAHIALLLTNLFFAINLSAAKHLTSHQLAGPFGINVVRVGVCVLLFWLLFALKPTDQRIEKKDWLRFVLCALTGIAINQMLFLKGLSLTYPIHASLLMLTTPILIVIIAAFLLKEKLSNMRILGLLMGIGGALVLVLGKENTGQGGNPVLGDMLVIINAISYTLYFILVKPLMQKYNPLTIIRWIFTIGFILILPFGWNEFNQIQWSQFSGIDVTAILLLVFTGTFLAYLFNLFGIKVLGASVAGFYIYTQPLFAAVIAMIFLKEDLTMYKILAAGLIFAGVYLTNKPVRNA